MKNKIENIHVVKDSNDRIWDKVLNCAKSTKNNSEKSGENSRPSITCKTAKESNRILWNVIIKTEIVYMPIIQFCEQYLYKRAKIVKTYH